MSDNIVTLLLLVALIAHIGLLIHTLVDAFLFDN